MSEAPIKLFSGSAVVGAELAAALALLQRHSILTAESATSKKAVVEWRGSLQLTIHLWLQSALRASASADELPPPRRQLARALHTLMASLFGAASLTLSCGWSVPALSTLSSLEPAPLYKALEEHTAFPPLCALLLEQGSGGGGMAQWHTSVNITGPSTYASAWT